MSDHFSFRIYCIQYLRISLKIATKLNFFSKNDDFIYCCDCYY